MRASIDHLLKDSVPLARLMLCGGIIGASSAGLLTHQGTMATECIGALLGAVAVFLIKLARIL